MLKREQQDIEDETDRPKKSYRRNYRTTSQGDSQETYGWRR